jgi:hypothetical protein
MSNSRPTTGIFHGIIFLSNDWRMTYRTCTLLFVHALKVQSQIRLDANELGLAVVMAPETPGELPGFRPL